MTLITHTTYNYSGLLPIHISSVVETVLTYYFIISFRCITVKAYELRGKSQDELLSQLDQYKDELSKLRVSKVSGQGGPSKLASIKRVRKSVARVLTIINESARSAKVDAYAGKKYKPLDLRVKKTRAIRRALTKYERSRKTLRQQKKDINFPQRIYAVKSLQ